MESGNALNVLNTSYTNHRRSIEIPARLVIEAYQKNPQLITQLNTYFLMFQY